MTASADRNQVSAPKRSLRKSMGVAANGHAEEGGPSVSLEDLRSENEQLRQIAAELKQQLEALEKPGAGSWDDREREFESLLEEKSEMIRKLNVRVGELDAAVSAAPAAKPAPAEPIDEDLLMQMEELAREQEEMERDRAQLDEERRQLRHDEEDMEQRMQDMERQVAKSRSDLVKQRNELQELYSMVRMELEKGQQSGVMSERMKSLAQRHQSLASGR
jgi:hypothetical protein